MTLANSTGKGEGVELEWEGGCMKGFHQGFYSVYIQNMYKGWYSDKPGLVEGQQIKSLIYSFCK